MPGSLSKSLNFSSPWKIVEAESANNNATQKQGIVTILGGSDQSDRLTPRGPASLRRTLSADMSSQKCLARSGLVSPIKKIASSEQISLSNIPDSSSSSDEDDECYDERKDDQERGQFDIWSSILSQKSESLSTPYIHPIVKRSSGTLSEKSLQICTESLGSETGSDGFSSYLSSETTDKDDQEDKEVELQKVEQPSRTDEEWFSPVKYNYKKSAVPARSFPPPIPSLSRPDGVSILMQSRRDDGRLVLEAVSVPFRNKFRAQRQDGRLVLSFATFEEENNEEIFENNLNEKQEEEYEEKYFNFEEEDEEKEKESEMDEEEDEDDVKINNDIEIMAKAQNLSSGVVLSVHRLAIMMNRSIGLANKNLESPKFNEVVQSEDDEEEMVGLSPVTQSLLPRPKMVRLIPVPSSLATTTTTISTTSLNAYEYNWPYKPTILKNNIIEEKYYEQVDKMRGSYYKKFYYKVPLSRRCKEPTMLSSHPIHALPHQRVNPIQIHY